MPELAFRDGVMDRIRFLYPSTRDADQAAAATSTLPLASRVAVCWARPSVMVPVAVQDPLLGSYSSAEALMPPTRLYARFANADGREHQARLIRSLQRIVQRHGHGRRRW